MKYIENYEGLYSITEDGKVFSHRKNRYMSIDKKNKGGLFYSEVTLYKDTKPKKHVIHRLIAKAYIPNPKNLPFVDHKDRNSLNNSIENLRWCTGSENMRNTFTIKANSTSKYKGVSWDKEKRYWIAYGSIDNKTINLGRYKDEIDAAKAYNKFAEEKYGDFALLNKIDG